MLGDARRARYTMTAADGTYRFTNLAAGAAEMVARHEFWQPARATAVVIGVRERTDFQFTRPSMSPLRGRVVRASTQEPIAGATVELEPISNKLGLVDPVATVSGEDGSFLLSGLSRGSRRLLVRHPDYGASLEIVSIRSVAKDVTVELLDRAVVAGKIEGVQTGGEILEAEDSGRELAYAQVQPDGFVPLRPQAVAGLCRLSRARWRVPVPEPARRLGSHATGRTRCRRGGGRDLPRCRRDLGRARPLDRR